MKISRRILRSGIFLVCAFAILFAFSGRILWSLGAMLNESGPPQKADIVVVLGGDYYGSRILTAAQLARQGYAPKVLVSGSGNMYGRSEPDLAIDFAVEKGYPRELFIPLHYRALSTTDEAAADIEEMHELGVHKYLLVTSVYHSARASRIFRREGAGLEMHPVSAPERYWPNGVWWKNREGRKLWLMEAMKSIADFLHI